MFLDPKNPEYGYQTEVREQKPVCLNPKKLEQEYKRQDKGSKDLNEGYIRQNHPSTNRPFLTSRL